MVDITKIEHNIELIEEAMDSIEYASPMSYWDNTEWQNLNEELQMLTNQMSLLLDQGREY